MGEIVLSFVLGFLTRLFWDRKNQKRIKKKEDRNVLTQLMGELSGFMGIVESGKRERTSFEYFDELYKLSFKILCQENKDLVDEIQNFVQENRGQDPISHPPLREKINSLKSKVEETLKKGGQ